MWARLGFQDGAVAALLLTVLLSFAFWPLVLWLGFWLKPYLLLGAESYFLGAVYYLALIWLVFR